MKIDRAESWYIFLFSESYFTCPSDTGSYITYQDKRLTNKEYLEHWGKWVFLGTKEEIDQMAEKLDPYVESEDIPCIKYDRAPQHWFEMEECVMCVYCDDREKDKVWKILSKFGVEVRGWSYEREVIKKWMGGGLHLERWIANHKLSEEDAEKLREEVKEKYEKRFLKNPNDICLGWEQ